MPSNPVVTVKAITPTHRKNVNILADVVFEITFDGEHTVAVADARVLEGKQGKGPWVSMPSYSIAAGKAWSYHSSVTLSAGLREQVSAVVLAAYAAWAKKNGSFINARVDASDVGF